jgi:predicted Zn-dependent peptidase
MNPMNAWRRPLALAGLLSALLVAATLATSTPPADAADLPARPEQLKYPPLKYAPPKAADYRVKLANGIAAYLAPDKAIPLVTVTVLMRVGPDLDPAGKEGLASTMVHLLTRGGTPTMTAEQLEERLAFLGAQLESSMGGGGGGMMGQGGVPITGTESRVTLNLLTKDLDEGLGLLTACLKGAAFQEDRLKLRKDQQLQNMKQRNDATADLEEREWGFLMRGAEHWSNRYPTEASINSLTRDDLVALQKRYVGPQNFVIAVAGDFDRAAMKAKLEQAFAGWPTPGENPGPPQPPTAPAAQGWYVVDKDVNQTRVSLGLRTLDRYDPDFYVAQVMNYVLGGGGFTSRLVNRIRSDEGLAYSVRSSFEGGAYYADPWRAFFQTKARSTAFAISIALTEIGRVRDSLVTPGELETAKSALIEGFPARFPTAQAIAGALAADELTGRYQKDPAHLSQYASRIGAVSLADVQRVAQRLLDPAKLAFLMVGSAKEMVLPDGKHDVTLTKLGGGEPKRIPLRDPMTMKPLP